MNRAHFMFYRVDDPMDVGEQLAIELQVSIPLGESLRRKIHDKNKVDPKFFEPKRGGTDYDEPAYREAQKRKAK